jgi:hypothetical protein
VVHLVPSLEDGKEWASVRRWADVLVHEWWARRWVRLWKGQGWVRRWVDVLVHEWWARLWARLWAGALARASDFVWAVLSAALLVRLWSTWAQRTLKRTVPRMEGLLDLALVSAWALATASASACWSVKK